MIRTLLLLIAVVIAAVVAGPHFEPKFNKYEVTR